MEIYSSITNLKNNVIWDIKNALEGKKLAIDDLVSQAMEDIKQYTKNETEEFINEMSKFEAFDSDVLRQALRYDTFDIYRDFSEFFDAGFININILKDIAWDNSNFFKWLIGQGISSYKVKVRNFTAEKVDENKEELRKKILENIDKFRTRLSDQVEKSSLNITDNLDNDLKNIKEKGSLNEKELNELIIDVNKNKNSINNFKEIKEDFIKKLENMEGEIYE